ncbi:PLP-dependent aminotransferase family protein [Rhizobiaceae bacterium BDR2-2]|uniref:PLP-dependent aminotransferase family protein n=1 Tax=Ectorhizobium quercum TaxID=2965071 RepID=A0AAE3SUR6_9HYPH|nr:PLP-dependent aminotransferase family protein [Ectorhizobium quercum]MCX8995560.1 PLP-dependent aminotransferase family protein [Ectorhizobium quercum]
MLEHFFSVPLDPGRKLQQQIQERIIEAILAGTLPSHEPLPATRILARDLGVARNTISLVYERLAEDGYLKPVKRRGYFIDERYVREQLNLKPETGGAALFPLTGRPIDYGARITMSYKAQRMMVKPTDWRLYAYPFIYGQLIPDRTSVSRWRDCIRQAGTAEHVGNWAADLIDADDPMLIDQIIRRILPKRGFRADPSEVLITVGAQHALFLAATLLCREGTRVGIEEPGYPDSRNIFLSRGARLKPQAVDGNGMRVTEDLAGCELVCVTPGHQSPTNVTMTLERRLQLLAAAEEHDFLIVEDDYESELNFVGKQRPALKSLDVSGRVLHVGSLSKPLFPGLRLGFIVAPRPLMEELRVLRRLMCRHPSALDQRAMAIFFADGHFDTHIRRQRSDLAQRWKTILQEMAKRLPDCDVTMTTGGSGLWVTLPKGMDARRLSAIAAKKGVLVEPGDVCYLRDNPPLNRIRMGFAAIARERIGSGIALLAEAVEEARA